MMTSPKEQFQKNAEYRRSWEVIVNTPVTQAAITITLAEMSLRSGMTTEALRGARQFAQILLSLSEEEAQEQKLPIRSLKSFDSPK